MVAHEVAVCYGDRVVQPILDTMFEISDRARFYSLIDSKVVLYLITDHDPKNLPDNLDWLYEIDGKIYESLGTGDIDYFQQETTQKTIVQLSLF